MNSQRKKIFITGGSGFVGSNLCDYFSKKSYDVLSCSRSKPHQDWMKSVEWVSGNITNFTQIQKLFENFKPDYVLHAAGMKNVPGCEKKPDDAHAINVEGTKNIASLAENHQAHLVYLSTDLVFPSTKGNYKESDTPQSDLVYGKTKYLGELEAMKHSSRLSICRSAGIFGRGSPLLAWAKKTALEDQPVEAFTDIFNSPTYLEDLGEMIDLLISESHYGIFHTVGKERVNRYDFFRSYFEAFSLPLSLLSAAECGENRTKMYLMPDSSMNSSSTRKLIRFEPHTLYEAFHHLRKQGDQK